MSAALAADRTIVSRLRIRRGAADPTLARLRAATLLSSAALTPGGLSPAAVLIVRRLSDPMPGRLGLKGAASRLPFEWEQAVRTQIEALARRALRPARDGAADTADAVMFADQGELLACLARDWLRGALERWWWQALFPGRDAATLLVRAWRERPECIPAAMAHLALRTEVAGFVSRLGRQGVRSLLLPVLAVFGVPEVHSALGALLQTEAAAGSGAHEPAPLEAEQRPSSENRPPRPWPSVQTVTAASPLEVLGEVFVGICDALHRTPHLVHGRDFAEQTRRWAAWQASLALSGRAAQPVLEPAATDTHSLRRSIRNDNDAALHPERVETPRGPMEKPNAKGKISAQSQKSPQAASLSEQGRPVERRAEAQAMQSAHAMEQAPAQHELDGWRIETQFGGVLFLLNLGLFLGLYGDFSRPAHRGLRLSIWEFVALIGEDLAGAPLRDDPVWGLLGQLAGRGEGGEAGQSLPPARRKALRRWLNRRLPSFRLRLRQALGVETDADVAAILLVLPARVWITPTRLDVSFALAELPIEVRLSGLDRDPGWVPAAGRAVYFHFD